MCAFVYARGAAELTVRINDPSRPSVRSSACPSLADRQFNLARKSNELKLFYGTKVREMEQVLVCEI